MLVRTERGMQPTTAGDAFLPHATQALEAVAAGRDSTARLARG